MADLPDPLSRRLVVEAVLITVTALCSFARAGVEQISESKLRKISEDGEKGFASRVIKTLKNPEPFHTSLQLISNATCMLAAVYGLTHFSPGLVSLFTESSVTPQMARWLGMGIVFFILLLAFSLFAKVIPRHIAKARPFQTLKITFTPAYFLGRIASPFSFVLTKITLGFMRVFKISDSESSEEVGEVEIRMMVDIGEEAGVIQSNEKEMIDNIFEFNNLVAEDVMIHRKDMVVIWMDDTQESILDTIKESGLSRFPVCAEDVDDIKGILNTRDYLLNSISDDPQPMESLLRTPYFVPESVHADILFSNMQREKIHVAIVVDEYGGTSGLITMEDLLEELVGEIYDEFDGEEELEIEQLKDNLWRVSGSAELDTIAEAMGIELPENDEYDTLGGMIFSCLAMIPDDGSKPEVDINGLHILVDRLHDRRVESALVSIKVNEPEIEENM